MNIHELIADLAQEMVTPPKGFHYTKSEEKFLKACENIKKILAKHGIKEN